MASRELAKNIDRAARGSNALSDQFGKVTQMAEANGEAANQLVSAAGGLQSQASALDGQAKQFANKVRVN